MKSSVGLIKLRDCPWRQEGQRVSQDKVPHPEYGNSQFKSVTENPDTYLDCLSTTPMQAVAGSLIVIIERGMVLSL